MIKKYLSTLGYIGVFLTALLVLPGQTTEPFPSYILGLQQAVTPLSGNELQYLLQSNGSRTLPVQTITGNTLPLVVNALPAAGPLTGNELGYLTQSGVSKNITALNFENGALPLSIAAAPGATLNGTELVPLDQASVLKSTTVNSISSFVLPGGNTGIQQNILNSQTNNYTIATSDCGKTINANSGFFTITLPGVGGFASNCVVTVKNFDGGRGKLLSGFPADINSVNQMLYPLQSITVGISAGGWTTLYNPGRWRAALNPTFFVDGTNGNDSNDGLVAGTGGAFQTIAQAVKVLSGQVDLQGGLKNATISLASGQTWTNTLFSSAANGPITLNGNGGTMTGTSPGSGAIFVNCSTPVMGGSPCLTVTNITFTCNSVPGLDDAAGIVNINTGITFGSCPGGSQMIANGNLAEIQVNNSYTISGGAASHVFSIGGGYVNFQAGSPVTITLTGTPAYSGAFANADSGSRQLWSNVSFSGAATGTRYAAAHGSSISSGGNGPNYFPGNFPGFVQRGGNYDSPGTPTITAGCASGNSVVGSSTDQAGAITTGGGGASTSCTLTFTTSNTPQSCVATTSNNTIIVAAAVFSTNVIFSYGSSTNIAINYSCPANP